MPSDTPSGFSSFVRTLDADVSDLERLRGQIECEIVLMVHIYIYQLCQKYVQVF